MIRARLALLAGTALAASLAGAQSVLFDFNAGPQFSGTPLDQISGGVRAHIAATGSGYSIQNVAQVIGVLPTGFSGLGLSPSSVFPADLLISFFNQSDGSPLGLSSMSIMVAPQELACDSSSTMKIMAYSGTTFLGSRTAISLDQNYTWPIIDLAFDSAVPFDNVVVHFQSGPPTGGDWGPIFVADNIVATPAPEPLSMVAFGLGLSMLRRASTRRSKR